jgi:hypothetical protein
MACGVVKWFNPPRANTTGCRHWQLSGLQSTGANLPIRRQWTPEEREQLLTLERPPSAPTAEAKKSPAGAPLAE